MNKIEQSVIELGGVWPGDAPSTWPHLGLYMDRGRMAWACYQNKSAADEQCTYICTYDDFMAARNKLANKPTVWPEWANWRAQDEDGAWYFYDKRPTHFGYRWQQSSRAVYCGKGHVFGDWRETLELRPCDKVKETPQTVALPAPNEGHKWEMFDSKVVGEYIAFRQVPIRTPRDEFIEEAREACGALRLHGDILGNLYDAGFRAP